MSESNLTIVKADAQLQRCTINDPFRNYKPESECNIRKLDIVQNKLLDPLKNVFRKLRLRHNSIDVDPVPVYYRSVIRHIRDLSYSSKDITAFAIVLSEFQDSEDFNEKAGLFLTALINNSKENNFTVVLDHLAVPVVSFGYRNAKNIIVKGNVGDELGREMNNGIITVSGNVGSQTGWMMEDGTITVNGNAERDVGRGMNRGAIIIQGNVRDGVGGGMSGGSILVNGDVELHAGWQMNGGIVTIKGNAGKGIGDDMGGGTIYLEGTYVSLNPLLSWPERPIRGKIYHKGKLIITNGKRLI